MIKVSVIIPAFKRVHHTRLCIDSILASNGIGKEYDIEIIVSDNSPDDSIKKLIKNYKDRARIIYLHEKKPIFVGESRRRGVDVSSGDLLIFSDSDIEVTPNAIRNLVRCFKLNPSAAMVTNKVIYKKKNIIGKIDRPRKEDRRMRIGKTIYQETNYGRFLGTYKKIFKYLGGYDSIFESRGEGVDLSCRYWRAGFPIVYAQNSIVYHHHDAPNSLTRIGDGTSKMFASLILMSYKYDINYKDNPSFIKIINNGRDFQDKKLFDPVLAARKMLDWFVVRYDDINKSKKSLPKNYCFSPQDVFTYKKELMDCIKKAPLRISNLVKK